MGTKKVLDTKKYLMYLIEFASDPDLLNTIQSYLNMVNEENAHSVLISAEKLSKFIMPNLNYESMEKLNYLPIENNSKAHLFENYDVDKSFGYNKYTDFISNLDKIDDIMELEDEQIIKLKEKLKEIEIKLKEKSKPKTITISAEIHNIIKEHCKINNLSLGEWCEKALLYYKYKNINEETSIKLIDNYDKNEFYSWIGNNINDFFSSEFFINKQIHIYSITRKPNLDNYLYKGDIIEIVYYV